MYANCHMGRRIRWYRLRRISGEDKHMSIVEHLEENQTQPNDLGGDDAARNNPSVWKRHVAYKVTIMAVGSFLLVWCWLAVVLQFDFMRGNSDVAGYWSDSLAWRTPFNPDHVPGYPLLIALLRFLTAGRLAPMVLFWA